jgi:hypothetical protein
MLFIVRQIESSAPTRGDRFIGDNIEEDVGHATIYDSCQYVIVYVTSIERESIVYSCTHFMESPFQTRFLDC